MFEVAKNCMKVKEISTLIKQADKNEATNMNLGDFELKLLDTKFNFDNKLYLMRPRRCLNGKRTHLMADGGVLLQD